MPYELDPSIIITSAGRVDPMRRVARVVQCAVNEKRFVSSAGVSSAWYGEGAEVTDDSPTLAQPTITCHKAMSFVLTSFEMAEDSDIAEQVGTLFADSKAGLDGTAFAVGTGSGQPKGLATAVTGDAGSVIATSTNAVGANDPLTLQNVLPSRWRPNARFMANLSILNAYRATAKSATLTEPVLSDAGPRPTMYGWEAVENSSLDGVFNAGASDYLLFGGDFTQFAIVDRIGATVELVPHLFGSNRLPSGERGFLLHWRTGSDCLVTSAFRVLNFNG